MKDYTEIYDGYEYELLDIDEIEREESTETIEEICKQLGLNSVAVENRLGTIFNNAYGNEQGNNYLNQII